MKMRFGARLTVIGFLAAGWINLSAQTYVESEVPGDNFSLEGALELFKKSSSPEDFEQRLNSPDSKVNNLDLNNDHYIDYIRVIDQNQGNVHAFILQAVLSERESQDVAVIELEKLYNGKAVLQITGDADIYGVETIIEPTEEVVVYGGTSVTRNVVNVWTWPSVQYVYSPYYVVYSSPWAWTYRPVWYRPWSPVGFHLYFNWWQPYRPYYRTCHTHRVYNVYESYRPYRTSSVTVINNYSTQINTYRNNYNYHDHGSGRTYHSYNDRHSRSDYSHNNDHRNNGNHYGQRNEHGNGNGNNGNGSNGNSNHNNWNNNQNNGSNYNRGNGNNNHNNNGGGNTNKPLWKDEPKNNSGKFNNPYRTTEHNGWTQRSNDRQVIERTPANHGNSSQGFHRPRPSDARSSGGYTAPTQQRSMGNGYSNKSRNETSVQHQSTGTSSGSFSTPQSSHGNGNHGSQNSSGGRSFRGHK